MSQSRLPIVCVFAKPARAGEVKTRLSRHCGAERAAQLAHAFFLDTWRSVSALPWARAILATTDADAMLQHVPPASVWSQGDGDLGRRIERVMRRALSHADRVVAIGADTPGLPAALLEQAATELDTADAVLGPADDGGFYLLGLKHCPEDLLRDVPWSAASTFAATRARLEARRMQVAILEPWFDVDRPADLHRLRKLIESGDVIAPETSRRLGASSTEP